MNPTGPSAAATSAFGCARAVLELAVSSRWRAPDVTVALADHAAALGRSEGDARTALRAEGWLLHGLSVIGRGAGGVPRALSALSEATRLGDDDAVARLRVGLASVARDLGDRTTAGALLAPVVGRDDSEPELVADAHIEVLYGDGSTDGLVDAVVGALRQLPGEHAELGLAALDAVLAHRYRLRGHHRAAVERAKEGLRRLIGERAGGMGFDPVSPHLAATACLELTLALLDGDHPYAACRAAEPAMSWAGRAGALVPLVRLRLALAHRVHLPAGDHRAALDAGNWASEIVVQHDLPDLEADCHSLLAETHERLGALPQALAASRSAHQSFRAHAARVEHALVLLARWADRQGSPSLNGIAWPTDSVPRKGTQPSVHTVPRTDTVSTIAIVPRTDTVSPVGTALSEGTVPLPTVGLVPVDPPGGPAEETPEPFECCSTDGLPAEPEVTSVADDTGWDTAQEDGDLFDSTLATPVPESTPDGDPPRTSGGPAAALQPPARPADPPNGGRHLATRNGPGPAHTATTPNRVTAAPGTGGRRRRPEAGRGPETVNQPSSLDAVPTEPVTEKTTDLRQLGFGPRETAPSANGIGGPDGRPAPRASRAPEAKPVSELSFAELLAGALAAYREG